MTFTEFQLHPNLLRGVEALGFADPTPIQIDAIPPAMAGKDVLACAMTGSGKTAAFGLPILHHLLGRPRGTTRALIVTPTRELAAQIVEHLDALAAHTKITCAAVFGGVGAGPQERAFRAGVDVIVATPGRLLDHFQYPYAKLDALEILVLDEADRMLDMGFLPDVRRVLAHIPRKRQTLFFSATLPEPIVVLSREMLNAPVRINIERKSLPAVGVRQSIYPVAQDLKTHLLLALLRSGAVTSAIVFTRTKHRANRLSEFLERRGVDAVRIHGNRSQVQRTEALKGLKEGRIKVLVATDIAQRGIDVEGLTHVINFDVPHVPDDYIHRVGRTARAGALGDAFTFVAPEEEGDLRAIERAVGKRLPRVKVDGFDYTKRPEERFEIPIGERIAEIRKRKAEDRARSREKAERKAKAEADAKALAAEKAAKKAKAEAEAPAQTGARRRRRPPRRR
ncbi:MAG: DEAD/DEAH box helicase [Proteobacteria bacterium]|jgi:ATP-dependent RNA helicase RhlE|nr:DEAD/DEAH box helicase [Pseudomonadota bacterium]